MNKVEEAQAAVRAVQRANVALKLIDTSADRQTYLATHQAGVLHSLRAVLSGQHAAPDVVCDVDVVLQRKTSS